MTSLRGLKILFVFATLDIGGSERQALLLARHLKEKHGADVRVWGLQARAGALASACDDAGIHRESIPFTWPESRRGKLLELARFAGRLRRERPDILLPFNLIPCIVTGLTWRYSGARLDVWSQRNAGNETAARGLHRLAVRLSPWFISNSEHGKRLLVETYGVDQHRIRVIPNGISLPPEAEGRDAWRRRMGVGDDCFVAVMVANIHYPKDHPTLLKAWRMFLDRTLEAGGAQAMLLLVGRPDADMERLKSLAFDLSLGGHLKVLGWIEDMSGLLHAADILVHSSKSEGMPNAVIEGMEAGLPVVATDIPGVREAVGPDGVRFLAPPEDPAALSGQIFRFWQNGTLRRSVGAAMKSRAEQVFDPGNTCERTAAFLAEALEKRLGNGSG